MDARTGEIVDMEEVKRKPENKKRFFRQIFRDLTLKEVADKQIRMYAPCGCGSGRKFKFCCHTKQ